MAKRTSARKTPASAARLQTCQRARRLYEKLQSLYPDAHCALNHRNAFELLVATILSAQCTDVRVNLVTPDLFDKHPTPGSMAKASLKKLEAMIRTTGFFRNKAKAIKGAGAAIEKEHDGCVPNQMEQLLNLPGVARKTANVVLGNAFQINDGVVVDTHVSRLSQRLGLSNEHTPPKIEQDLMRLFDRKGWTMLSHLLIFHGRQVCRASHPNCDACQLARLCPRIGVET